DELGAEGIGDVLLALGANHAGVAIVEGLDRVGGAARRYPFDIFLDHAGAEPIEYGGYVLGALRRHDPTIGEIERVRIRAGEGPVVRHGDAVEQSLADVVAGGSDSVTGARRGDRAAGDRTRRQRAVAELHVHVAQRQTKPLGGDLPDHGIGAV